MSTQLIHSIPQQKIPEPFYRHEGFIYRAVYTRRCPQGYQIVANSHWKLRVCGDIDSVCRDRNPRKVYGYQIGFHAPDGVLNALFIPDAMLIGSPNRACMGLANTGLWVNIEPVGKRALIELINAMRVPHDEKELA